MKKIFTIEDNRVIEDFFAEVEYGTLAICANNRPYSLPLNFVKVGNVLYFHGAKKGRKIEMLEQNSYGSFSVVKAYSLIASYFSSDDALACPATQFFKSVIAEGEIVFVQEQEEKVMALSALMQKLQPEGGYRPLKDEIYAKVLKATMVYKLEIEQLQAKFKFGQPLPKERFEKILEHLDKRNSDLDRETMTMMKALRTL